MIKIPTLYKQYPFFDDGKYSPSRFYVATVVRIMTIEDAKDHTIILREEDPTQPGCCKTIKLYDLWKEVVEDHKSDHIWPHTEEGYWCYAPKTECFIVCAIPEYDNSLIYFARHINGGWVSFCTTGFWQVGMLDVECHTFSGYQEDYPDLYYKYKELFNVKEDEATN